MTVWFRSRLDRTRDLLIEVLREEVTVLRKGHALDLQRIDRLTEALARKANIDLIMPLPEPAPVERTYTPNPWKDPSPVTDRFPDAQSGVKIPTFSKEKTK